MQSEQVNELAKALSAFQGECTHASVDKVNPAFKSRYATLASVWESIRPLLAKHSLSVIQQPEFHEAGLALRTTVLHTSGQCVDGVLVIPLQKRDAQGVGSAMTYARRYGLCAMLGIVADDDDDGNDAAARAKRLEPTKTKDANSQPLPDLKTDINNPPNGVTPPMVSALMKQFQEKSHISDSKEAYPRFVAFVQETLDSSADFGKAKNWTLQQLSKIGDTLKHVNGELAEVSR